MAKTKPGKKDLDSYTIKGTNKVVRRTLSLSLDRKTLSLCFFLPQILNFVVWKPEIFVNIYISAMYPFALIAEDLNFGG